MGVYQVGENIYAQYSASSGRVVVVGSGPLDRKEWMRLKGWIATWVNPPLQRLDIVSKTEPICFPEDSSNLFEGLRGNIVFGGRMDTSRVVCADFMFASCEGTVENVGGWDMSNVKSMRECFFSSSVAIDVSGWDVSNVEDMSEMFASANLSLLDISRWDVSNVTSMDSMFRGSFGDADVSGWDTSRVRNMCRMFARCSWNPDVSLWETGNVVSMEEMFANTQNANPDVRLWDTSRVRSMRKMFAYTQRATPEVGRWNVGRVEDMRDMFLGAEKACPDVSGWRFHPSVRNARRAQLGCALPLSVLGFRVVDERTNGGGGYSSVFLSPAEYL